MQGAQAHDALAHLGEEMMTMATEARVAEVTHAVAAPRRHDARAGSELPSPASPTQSAGLDVTSKRRLAAMIAEHVQTLIIGGGQAGLNMSHMLSRCGCPHLVLERGRIGERWRSERWDGLRFQFPNWSVKLPDFPFPCEQPDGYRDEPRDRRLLGDLRAAGQSADALRCRCHRLAGGRDWEGNSRTDLRGYRLPPEM